MMRAAQLILFVSIAVSARVAAQSPCIWDLAADWSTTANPSGPWSYEAGGVPFATFQPNWVACSNSFTPNQGGWAAANCNFGHIPVAFRLSSIANFPLDIGQGEVGVHSWDGFNGPPGYSPVSITWTSPIAGVIDVDGSAWLARTIGRSVAFLLTVNGSPAASASLVSGGPFTRATPYSFASSGVSVVPGSQVRMQFVTTSAAGDFVGMRLTIRTQSCTIVPTTTFIPLATGGAQTLLLNPGPSFGGSTYLVAGTLSGTSPGIPVGPFVVPLNPDSYFLFTVGNPNTPPLVGSLGVLSPSGQATAQVVIPPGTPPVLAGLTAFHAYAVINPASSAVVYVSGPAPLTLVP